MVCGKCHKEVMGDSYFCNWCSAFIPSPSKGTKANLFVRWVALILDPLIAIVLYIFAVLTVGTIVGKGAIIVLLLFPFAYFIWFLTLLRQGLTPGKKLLGLQVVNCQTGQIPGFGKMFLREIIGRFISVILLGFGYWWALFDKNSQGLHDKLAGTVVLKRTKVDTTKIPVIDKPETRVAITPAEPVFKRDLNSPEFIAKLDILKKRIDKDSLNPALYIELGTVYQENGLLQEALIEFQKALGTDSSNIEALLNSGKIYLLQNDFAKAEASFFKASNLAPVSINAKTGLFSVYFQSGNDKKAIEIGEEIVKSGQADSSLQKSMAMLYEQAGLTPKAIHQWESIVLLVPNDNEALKSLASLYEEAGEQEKAFEKHQKLLESNPELGSSRFFCGKYYLAKGNFQETVKQLEPFVNKLQSDEAEEIAHLYLADAFINQGNLEKAIGYITDIGDKTLAHLSDEDKVYAANAGFKIGQAVLKDENYQAAERYLSKATEFAPGNDEYKELFNIVRASLSKRRAKATKRGIVIGVSIVAIGIIAWLGWTLMHGRIGFQINPAVDCTIMVDGKQITDVTGGNLNLITSPLLIAGVHKVLIVANGYEKWESQAAIGWGRRTNISVNLEPIYGSLEISSIPSGIGVVIDSKQVGNTPLRLDKIVATSHNISLQGDEFLPWDTTIAINPSTAVLLKNITMEGRGIRTVIGDYLDYDRVESMITDRVSGKELPKYLDRSNVLHMHPFENGNPCLVERSLVLPRRTATELRASFRSALGYPEDDPGTGDFKADIIIRTDDGLQYTLYSKEIAFDEGWQQQAIDLSQFAGHRVSIRFEGYPTGWNHEYAAVDYFYVLAKGPRDYSVGVAIEHEKTSNQTKSIQEDQSRKANRSTLPTGIYFAEIRNIDDDAIIYINGIEALKSSWGKGKNGASIGHTPGLTGLVDIGKFVQEGKNTFRFVVINKAGCCGTSGMFRIFKGDKMLTEKVFSKEDSSPGIKYDESVDIDI